MPTTQLTQRQFPCSQCGASLTYEPGTTVLLCQHCGGRTPIAGSNLVLEELDYESYVNGLPAEEAEHDQLTVRCTGCGAETHLGENVTADKCVFCGAAVVAEGQSRRLIKPRGLLPFAIPRKQAEGDFRGWISSLWFAPSDLCTKADCGGLVGVYIPCWTFDTNARTAYIGERGDDYWETETYTETVDGKEVTRTRDVLKTRWWPCSGSVENSFDDLLVMASKSLPPKQAAHLEPWDLEKLVPYTDEYLSGFAAESYQVDLQEGFVQAKAKTEPTIRRTVESDIGGDHQRIFSLNSTYFDITFKHLLLPLWISAYVYAGQSYRFLINARTGEVQGERPYSPWKIAALVIAIIAVIVTVAVIANARH